MEVLRESWCRTMTACDLDHLVVTDQDLAEAGYRTSPYDDSGNYVGAPKVRDDLFTLSRTTKSDAYPRPPHVTHTVVCGGTCIFVIVACTY